MGPRLCEIFAISAHRELILSFSLGKQYIYMLSLLLHHVAFLSSSLPRTLCYHAHARTPACQGSVVFRAGEKSDELPISIKMASEAMNPLGVDHERFIVAGDGDNARIGFGQIRDLGTDSWELASLYVEKEFRNQGIGGEIVRRLLQEHSALGRPLDALYLLTLKPTTGFYRPFGFRDARESEVPTSMAFEIAAGKAVSLLLGNELACMRHSGEPRANSVV